MRELTKEYQIQPENSTMRQKTDLHCVVGFENTLDLQSSVLQCSTRWFSEGLGPEEERGGLGSLKHLKGFVEAVRRKGKVLKLSVFKSGLLGPTGDLTLIQL